MVIFSGLTAVAMRPKIAQLLQSMSATARLDGTRRADQEITIADRRIGAENRGRSQLLARVDGPLELGFVIRDRPLTPYFLASL